MKTIIIDAYLWLTEDEYNLLKDSGMTDVEIKAMAGTAFSLAVIDKISSLRKTNIADMRSVEEAG